MTKRATQRVLRIKACILAGSLATALAWGQSPLIIQQTKTMMNTVQSNQTKASNEALGISQSSSTAVASKPAARPAKAPAASAVAVQTKSSAPVKAKSKTPAPSPAAPKAPRVAAVPLHAGAIAAVPATAPAVPAASPLASAAAPASQTPEAKPAPSPQDKTTKWSASGKRDPFISPVVNHAGGSGCSTGKKCLEIGSINLRGVVRSESGFIAVVTNSLNKAYFLRENDPVFDGYVIRITGDSIVFQETQQDQLGKPFTREVVKKIITPAV